VCALAAPVLCQTTPVSPSPHPSVVEAERLMAKKDYRAAETLLRAAIAENGTDARAHGDLALLLMSQGRKREAVDAGRLSAAFAPDTPEARYIYGLTLAADGRPVEAARELARAVALKPGQTPALRALAQAYADTEDERTSETFRQYIAMRPGDAAARRELAEYLWRVERVEDGNRVMDDAVRAFPSDASLRLSWGRELAQRSLYLDAAKQLEKARELGATDAATLALLAAAYTQLLEVDTARAVLTEAAALHPRDAAVRTDLGRLCLSQNRPEEALAPLEEAARLNPRNGDIRCNLGRAQEALGRLEDAEASYREAVRLAPNLPAAHYALGRLLVKTGRRADGEAQLAVHRELYEKGLARVSESEAGGAGSRLGWSLLQQGKPAEALARFEAVPESPDALRGKAAALARLNRHADAVRALERASQLAPDDRRLDLLLAAERSQAAEAR
jgi:protein O-GlcNAc transferase